MSAANYASMELQQWRMNETEKNIEAIKQHEIELNVIFNKHKKVVIWYIVIWRIVIWRIVIF